MSNYKKPPLAKALAFVLFAIVSVVILITKQFCYEAPAPSGETGRNLEVTFIDVGQGDATLLHLPDGQTLLVDGGEYDQYETELLPFLKEQDIHKIDIAIVTHYHSDHMGGIQKLLQDDGIVKLILPDYPDTDDTRQTLELTARKNGTAVDYISAGNIVETTCDELKILAIHPQEGGADGSNYHNNSSVVLKIAYGKTDILITGDIESRTEKEIIQHSDVECDILKVAHHGSSSSSSKKFIEASDPTYAIISAGKDNRYGHPHAEVISTLEDEDIRIFRTYQDGNITFVIDEEKILDIKYSK